MQSCHSSSSDGAGAGSIDLVEVLAGDDIRALSQRCRSTLAQRFEQNGLYFGSTGLPQMAQAAGLSFGVFVIASESCRSQAQNSCAG